MLARDKVPLSLCRVILEAHYFVLQETTQGFTLSMELLAGAWDVEGRTTQENTPMLVFLLIGSRSILILVVCIGKKNPKQPIKKPKQQIIFLLLLDD